MISVFRAMLLSGAVAGLLPAQPAGVRILLGLTDKEPVRWDGSVTARGAKITAIEPWRFEIEDSIGADHTWKLSTHPIRVFGGGLAQLQPRPIVANGVVVWVDQTDGVELEVKTAQGNFTARLAEIPYGKRTMALDGRAMVDRVPPVTRLTSSADEQDYPAAAAGKDGSVWVTYLEFKHHPDHDRLRANFAEAPANFDALKSAPGGDQILVKRFASGAWSEPIAITAPGGDLYRPTIAVDGSGRAWVFWSANQNGNFDLWARAVSNGQPGATTRITKEAGSDIDPVAATDSSGRVWVAWQGWRNGRAAIFAAAQRGDGFTAPAAVSSSSANEWNPAIAASGDGRVTVAWDSYRNGNYDIFSRTATAPGTWGKETAAAASARYEAYPSVAYDPSGRLWMAYEEGATRWGKDFGAYDTAGVALYQGRAVRLRGFEKDGREVEAAHDPGSALPGPPIPRVDVQTRQADNSAWLEPRPELYKSRVESRPAPNAQGPRNSMPRLAVDSSGRLWLAARSAHPVFWNPLGTVWTEHVISYDGKQWTGPVFLTHSDNLLDNRPALVSTQAGRLWVVGSSDSRRQFQLGQANLPPRRGAGVRDPYNNDLYVNELSLTPAAQTINAQAVGQAVSPALDPLDKAEAATIVAIRTRRIKSENADLKVLRGEFHRHSEVSGDGGADGTILDQWRYALDASSMDWVGCCDHDNGGGREYTWWMAQKLTDIFYTPGRFAAMFSYERSVQYPEGHRNVIFAQRGIRTLPRLPITSADALGRAPDTQMLYRYLQAFNGIVAMHTSGTNMGTDWRDNDPATEPVVEIYQGDRQNYEMPGAPRSNRAEDSIGGWRPKGFVNLALEMGYKLAFQASSDHISTHMSYCNVLARDATREAVLEGFQKRHVYGATDNIFADFRSGTHILGDAFTTSKPPELRVKLGGTAPFAKVHLIKNDQHVYSIEPKKRDVEFTWRDNSPAAGKTSYYYVRGEQEDGEIVWVSPMWITYQP